MKKLIAKTLAILILLAAFNIQTASASFSDVTKSHKNFDAIIYLQEHGVIHGYPDGTFRPANHVNRAEFLKIILEGSQIPLDTAADTPFPDVHHNNWYAPYVKKAYSEGWIHGYPDGTFKPEQTINKAESLKILGEVQDWELPESVVEAPYQDTEKLAWYTKYAAYAKDHDYLEETDDIFSPGDLMTRANISEIIYRTLTVETESIADNSTNEDDNENNSDVEDATEEIIEDEESEELDFTPIEYKTISKNFYDNISLTESLPNTFYKNEVYVIKGEIPSGNYTKTTVLIETSAGSDQKIFSGNVESNNFEVTVHFRESGNFYLGIIPGEEGSTKTTQISVLPNIPSSSETENPPNTPASLTIDYEHDETFIQFDAQPQTIKKLIFSQDNEKVTYVSRQNTDSININYSDFEKFEEGEVSYTLKTAVLNSEKPLEISSDFITGSTKKFNAVEHTYDLIEEGMLSVPPPDRLITIQPISFIGAVNTETQITGYITKPDGNVDKTTLSTFSQTSEYFGNTIIPEDGDFLFEYSPSTAGRYIIEIVDKNGLPLINHPVYIGDIIPLIPDYFDLHARKFFSGKVDLENLREELLEQINISRQEHGLPPVTISDELNSLAQAHSQDMAENNFFAHINLNNETPENRRIKAGIATPVSENIAMDVSIIFGHFGLMRSPTHRENILNEGWTRVGLGISLDEGYLFITEEFSGPQATEEILKNYKSELFTEINEARINNNVAVLSYNDLIEMASIDLNNKVIQQDAILTNDIFQEALTAYNISGTSQAVGRTYYIWQEILSSILEESAIIGSLWDKIGIDIQADKEGNIHTLLILNQP